ncbi:unnamed protein product, partial [Meganyctiphanes norvegica]
RLAGSTGILTLRKPHMLNNITSINLNVSVTDGIHIVFTTLQVTVMDLNYYLPRFRSSLFKVHVDENNTPGKMILSLSPDGIDQEISINLQYKIVYEPIQNTFRLDNDGDLYVESKLDREIKQLHEVKVSVSNGKNIDFATVHVMVKDKNDNAPVFALKSYQGNLPNDAGESTFVLQVNAKDEDEGENSRLTYSITETEGSNIFDIFSVEPISGVIVINYKKEKKSMYQFSVRAKDNGVPPNYSDVPITIYLLFPSAFIPKCKHNYLQYFIREDAPIDSIITTFWINGSKFMYDIISIDYSEPDNHSLFAINPLGHLVLQGLLDYEYRNSHYIIIENKTVSTPTMVDYMAISIVVLDVNDCSPQFSKTIFELFV